MSEFYTLPGTPSDLMTSQEVGNRQLKVSDPAFDRAIDLSGSVKFLTQEHAKVHDGYAYICEFMLYLNATTEQDLIFTTGDYPIHMKEVELYPDSDEIVGVMFEDSVTVGGTQQTFDFGGVEGLSMQPKPLNRFRPPFDSGCEVLASPTITTVGTEPVFIMFLPGESGVGQSTSGTIAEVDWERVLKAKHRYHLWVKRLAGTGTARVKVKIKFYLVP